MQACSFTVTLRLRAPLLTKSSAAGRLGVDAPMAVNADGKFILPGSLVKGRLRQSWEELHEAVGSDFEVDPLKLRHLLGHESERPKDESEGANPFHVEPERGRLQFEDFVCQTTPSATTPVRHRIKISRLRHSVDKGMLQVEETAFTPGTPVEFIGKVRCLVSSDLLVVDVERWLRQGLRFINQFGGERTVGFGRLIDAEVEQSESSSPVRNSTRPLASPITLQLAIRPAMPFCLSEYRYGGNVFKSGDTIHGNAIKGCRKERNSVMMKSSSTGPERKANCACGPQ